MGETLSLGTAEWKAGAYLARPVEEPRARVLVLHAWWGLTDFFRGLCDRLASEGFVALAVDLHEGKTADTPEQAQKLLRSVQSDLRIKYASVGLDRLLEEPAKQPGVALVGLSMGASYGAWVATLRPELRACVFFYGGSELDAGFVKESSAALLGHFAEHDDFDPADQVPVAEQSLREAGADVTFHIYPGTGHWFFETDRSDAYDKEAAELAWRRTVEFLHARVG